MNKKLSLVVMAIVFSFACNSTFAQEKGFYSTPYKSRNSGSFEKGTSILSIGYGVGTLNTFGFAGVGYRNRFTLGPVYLKYELGIMDEVSVGGFIAMQYTTAKYIGSPFNSLGLGVGVLGYYHFNKFIPVKNLDVYAGAGFGVKLVSETYSSLTINNNSNTYLRPLVKVGARYYFTDKFGVDLESGYDNLSSLNIGIALKF